MRLYVVKNETNEEFGSYTDPQQAHELAQELQDGFDLRYIVEELDCHAEPEPDPDKP